MTPIDSGDLLTTGVAILPAGASIGDPGVPQSLALHEVFDEASDWGPIPHAGGAYVIELTKPNADQPATLDHVTLWWSPGEPAFIQTVDLGLTWEGDSCQLSAAG